MEDWWSTPATHAAYMAYAPYSFTVKRAPSPKRGKCRLRGTRPFFCCVCQEPEPPYEPQTHGGPYSYFLGDIPLAAVPLATVVSAEATHPVPDQQPTDAPPSPPSPPQRACNRKTPRSPPIKSARAEPYVPGSPGSVIPPFPFERRTGGPPEWRTGAYVAAHYARSGSARSRFSACFLVSWHHAFARAGGTSGWCSTWS